MFTVSTNELLLYRTIISTLVNTCKFTLLEKTIEYTISIIILFYNVFGFYSLNKMWHITVIAYYTVVDWFN